MNTLEQRIANLSPAKRALLEKHLQEQSPQQSKRQTIPRRASADPAPLSFAQQRLWFLDQLQPGATTYNNTNAYKLSGSLNLVALQQSLDEIIRRHESLRTTFTIQNGEPLQIIQPALQLPIVVIDLRHLAADEQESERLRWAAAERQRSFDLTSDLMRRVTLLRFAKDEHLLLLTSHHIASDGWSNGIFWRELSGLYAAFAQGKPSPLPDLPIQYADYAVWQRQWLQGEQATAQLAYWQKQLANLPPYLTLPTDFARPSQQTFRGANYRFNWSQSLVTALKQWGQHHQATLFMTLLTGLHLLLQRYSGQDEIVIGSAIAGRTRTELEHLIGFFLNNLVLRTRLHPNMTAEELLAQVRTVTLNAYANQDMPFEKLLEVLHPQRDLSYNPLFQVMLILQNTPPRIVHLEGLQIERLAVNGESTTLDIMLSFTEQNNMLQGVLTYSTDLFSECTIARMMRHYHVLLEAMVSSPALPITDLPMLTVDEQQQMLVDWNVTQVDFGKQPSLIEQFQTQVARTPDAIAFVCGDAQLSYRELEEQSNQFTQQLLMLKVKPGTVIGLCIERSLTAVTALLAIWKVGAVYVPLDPTYPTERLHFMIQDAGITVIVTNHHWSTQFFTALASPSPTIFCLDNFPHPLTPLPVHPVTLSPGHPGDPAYILYTSGSTGKPKGVVVPHRQILNRLAWMWRAYPLQSKDVGCQKTSLNFVDSLWELFGYLLQGRPTVIIPDTLLKTPQKLVQYLAERRVTQLWLVPTLLRFLLDQIPDLAQRLSLLTFWVVSGETLSDELLKRFRQQMPHARLYNLYGTSEVWDATWYDPSSEEVSATHEFSGNVPIGRPIANVTCYILDAQYRPVPVGVIGELYVGGVGLANGYLNHPTLTDEKFVEVELPTSNGKVKEKLYKTGDLARYRANGLIDFIGRNDFQVKIRGFRVELGEIENLLAQHPAIKACAIHSQTTVNGEQQLIGYFISQAAAPPTSQMLRQYLLQSLPDYMIPSIFIGLEHLPLTASGKIDRLALPAPDTIVVAPNRQYIAARDPLEQQLTQIWEDVLKTRPIGIGDNFFDLGGHSLLAVQLFEQIAKITGRTLPLATLFQTPTIEALATALRQQDWSPNWKSLTPIRPGGSLPPLFVIPPAASTVLRFAPLLDHLDPDLPIYGIQHRGLEDGEAPFASVEAMATHYIDAIRTLRPVGPYLLAGICFGAHVAFEMAQQLTAQGETVPLVAVIDAGPPNSSADWGFDTQNVRRIDWHLERFRIARQSGEWGEMFSYYLRAAKQHIRRWWLRKPMHYEFMVIQWKAQCKYQSNYYPGSLLLFQSEEFAKRALIAQRWRTAAPEKFGHIVIPNSTHTSLLLGKHYLQTLANALMRAIHQSIKANPQ